MRALQFVYRGLAAVYIIAWVFAATDSIGNAGSNAPLTLGDAWKAICAIALGLWLGWMAGRESKGSAPGGA